MKKFLLAVLLIASLVAIMTACDYESVAAFHEGYRAGWNSTAPEEYQIR